MNKEVVLMLSELRSQIDDAIIRVKKESAADEKEIMSTLEGCDLIDVDGYIIFLYSFLEWCVDCGFLEKEDEEITICGHSCATYKYVSKNDLIRLDKNGNVFVHPSLLYVYLNSGKDV